MRPFTVTTLPVITCLFMSLGCIASASARSPENGTIRIATRTLQQDMPQASANASGVLGGFELQQMTNNAPNANFGIACSADDGSTFPASYWRRFYPSEHGSPASITTESVTMATSSGASIPVTVNVYSIPGSTPVDTVPTALLTLLGSGSGMTGAALTTTTIAVVATLTDALNNDLVVEYHLDTAPTGWFPGANGTLETHPSFFLASNCGVTEPTTMADIGFANDHNIIVVNSPDGELADPSGSFSPTSLSFTVAANQTATDSVNIANAAGRSPLTFLIESRDTTATLSAYGAEHSNDAATAIEAAGPGAAGHFGGLASPYPWQPIRPQGSLSFQLDDGSYENNVSWGNSTTEFASVWINRFAATGALNVDSISITWPTHSSDSLVGLQANLVAYYDANADGNLLDAVRLGTNNLVTITALNVFETYPSNFFVPGAGDVYIGFVDHWAFPTPSTPRFFPVALDQSSPSQLSSYVSAVSTAPVDVNHLANNDHTGEASAILGLNLGGNFLIRASGTLGGSGGPCKGPIMTWLSASLASGSVNGGENIDLTISANPSADNLTEGNYSAELCVTTNDPNQLLVAIPVDLTVTAPIGGFCSGGADTIFCDGFDPSAAANAIP